MIPSDTRAYHRFGTRRCADRRSRTLGIGAACHLQRRCPGKTYAILEARDRIGGTWDLFRYPGIRSDSDMHTLGYSFRPWKAAKSIADGPAILSYIEDTARRVRRQRQDPLRPPRRQRRLVSTDEARWHVVAERTETDEQVQFSARFLMFCSGYYRYDQGYTPELPGADRFDGPIVHPQKWPEDLDYAGKRVVVIGSGATAVTLVPAMAQSAAHVTMLQRSPSYVVSLPAEDALASGLRRVLPPMAAYHATRFKNVALMTLSYQLSRRRPHLMKALIRKGAISQLPGGFRRRHALQPDVQPVGPAPVRVPRRRPLPCPEERQRVGRDRSDSDPDG